MSRRKKTQQHSSHERWLVSYADFITLLFAFFVVLYASAQVDKRKVGQLAMAIQVAFQKMGVFDASNTKPEVLETEPMPFSKVQMVENVTRAQDLNQLVSSPQGDPSEDSRRAMDQIQNQLQNALLPELKNRTVSITPTKEGIVVSLREAGFFASGSANLRPEAESTLADFLRVVGPYHVRIRIEGHTDNVPIHNYQFDSNWDLSTARATAIIKLFISKYGIAPDRLSAAGYGEYYPVASNDTPGGRAQNRRVDLVILTPNSETGPPLPSDSSAVSGIGRALQQQPAILRDAPPAR
jgi:chemotaxis protein MotB